MLKQAMILSAGLGSRMGELTQAIPKPMLMVDNMSLIERHLHYLKNNRINKIIINTHYKAEIFEDFIRKLPIYQELEIYFSREEELLGTAGGVKEALPILGEDPFLVINSDAIFVDDDSNNSACAQLEANWDIENMPIITLLAKKDRAFGYWSNGDFDMNEKKQITLNKENGQYIYAGMSLMDYRVFAPYLEKILQFYPTIYQDLISKNQLYGNVYQGKWFHIGDAKAYHLY